MLVDTDISFDLDVPWQGGRFSTKRIGTLNFLVGPNGSGKSRFARMLQHSLGKACRTLGTDRLRGFEQNRSMHRWGDPFADGRFQKSEFIFYKEAGQRGFGLDTFVILEERLDIRLEIEAMLASFFKRKIVLDWDSGLVPRATLGPNGPSYSLVSDECHGIKELLVILTHLLNDDAAYLIIDEPELHLHPQFQGLIMQQIRRVTNLPVGDPRRKQVFLITHSPFMLDFRTNDDIRSIVTFYGDLSAPHHLYDLDQHDVDNLRAFLPRLNAKHKQIFFSDNPIVVEGADDAALVEAIQMARGASLEAAGSCLIEAGGSEEASKCLQLCRLLRKEAHFLYDLDSLFRGNLRNYLRDDQNLTGVLRQKGLGRDFATYCGQLDQRLFDMIRILLKEEIVEEGLRELKAFVQSLPRDETTSLRPDAQQKARVAVLVQLRCNREPLERLRSVDIVEEIAGRLDQIRKLLFEKRIYFLTGGALENYCPSFSGNKFSPSESSKHAALTAELAHLTTERLSDNHLEYRYGELFDAVKAMPSVSEINIESVMSEYIVLYIFYVQRAMASGNVLSDAEVERDVGRRIPGIERLLKLNGITRFGSNRFTAEITVAGVAGKLERVVSFSHDTIAGMRQAGG